MKILLIAVNAKYIHSNPAVYSLKMSTGKSAESIEIAEYTINHQIEEVIMDIYKKKADILAFSCYIWNIGFIEEIIKQILLISPKTIIWLGGPEVSYFSTVTIEKLKGIKGIINGEGEETFNLLVNCYLSGEHCDERLSRINNITFLSNEKKIIKTEKKQNTDINKLKFIYDDLSVFENRIIYYESSRGCPFSCAYCLSATENKLRFKDTEKVKKEIGILIGKKVPQIKFIDRTFNCNKEHSREIWNYLIENDNGETNFHFEIAADLLEEKDLELLKKMRPGLVQFEIGVQSTNIKTLKEINRKTDIEKIKINVNKISGFKNIHQHLDLIAGLPFEDIKSFKKSFDDVFLMQPDQLQLGFLKVLKGTPIYEKADEYGMVFKPNANYEILKTKWLNYDEIIELKEIEEVLEIYYNSGQFKNTLKVLKKEYESSYNMFYELSAFYNKNNTFQKHSRINNYFIFLDFIKDKFNNDNLTEIYKELLTLDLYLREKIKKRPDFSGKNIHVKDNNIHIEEFGRDIFLFIEKGTDNKITQRYLFDYSSKNNFLKTAKIEKFTE